MYRKVTPEHFSKKKEKYMDETEISEDETVNALQNGLQKFLKFLFKNKPQTDEPFKESSYIERPKPESLINHDKYTFEDGYEVVTQDGYKLKLHRINKKKSNPENAEFRDVVFLQHGLLDASVTWFMDENGLAFTLADAGYDVWLGNIRGNVYSTEHVQWDKDNDDEYWKFTWDDMASKDLPAMIDFVLEKTKKPNLYYVGHSQGGLIGFVELSRNPKLASQVKHFFALAPAVYLGNMTSPLRLLIDAKYYFLRIFYLLITLQFLPWSWPSSILTNIIKYPTTYSVDTVNRISYQEPKRKPVKTKEGIWNLRGFRHIISFFFHLFAIITGFFICVRSYAKNIYERILLSFMMTFWQTLLGRKGVNDDLYTFLSVFPALENLYNESDKQMIVSISCGVSESLTNEHLNHCIQFFPSDSSVRNLLHFMQLVRSGRPATFNHGAAFKNQILYQQPDPIPFNVRNIDPEKCTIFFGENDTLVPPNDIKIKLRGCTKDLNLIFGFNHVDFVWSPEAKDKVYSKMLVKMHHLESKQDYLD